jgi:hypothetical protein
MSVSVSPFFSLSASRDTTVPTYHHIITPYNTTIPTYHHITVSPRQPSSACYLHLPSIPSQVSFSSVRQATAASPQVITPVYVAVPVPCLVRHHLAIRPPPSIRSYTWLSPSSLRRQAGTRTRLMSVAAHCRPSQETLASSSVSPSADRTSRRQGFGPIRGSGFSISACVLYNHCQHHHHHASTSATYTNRVFTSGSGHGKGTGMHPRYPELPAGSKWKPSDRSPAHVEPVGLAIDSRLESPSLSG